MLLQLRQSGPERLLNLRRALVRQGAYREAVPRVAAKAIESAFMDAHHGAMPGMDGYEVARRIRREPWGKEVRLVALTG